MKKYLYFFGLFLTLILLISCSNDDNSTDVSKNGSALNSAKGHSFQFYSKTKWMFSVHVSDAGKITTAVSTGTLYGNNIFDYHQINDREATCLVFVGFAVTLGGNTYYDSYSGDMVLTYTSSKGGCFSMYNSVTGENWKGSFTVDDKERDTPPTNNCWGEDPSGDNVEVTSVALNKSALSLAVGAKETLLATVSPSDATDKSVTWKTSAANIANVSSTGEIIGVSAGTATITVTTNNNAKTATCTVIITSGNNGGGEVDPWVDDPNIDVYAAGQEESQATLWKNGVSQRLTNGSNAAEAYSVFVSGNDVYVAGLSGSIYDRAFLWKNGLYQGLNDRNYSSSFAYSVFVSGNDVYVGGSSYSSGGGSNKATLWKNGKSTMLTQSPGGIFSSGVNSIFVSGSDVYMTGSESMDLGVSSACLWKNNEIQRYTDKKTPASLSDIFVSGGDVYVVGYEEINNRKVATLWKNGIPKRLSDGQNNAAATSVFVSGSDVYVAGYETIGSDIAIVWKNGVQQKLTNGEGAYAKSIFVIDNDVYVAGYKRTSYTGTSGIVWKNGIPRVFGNFNASLNSVYVVRK